MSVQGTEERILDSVLPHEITHTIFASHFASLGKYVPRWADEGACTTVEHEDEKSKHRHYLRQFLQTNRGLSFNKMFSLKEYPADILPLYAQGHSAVQFLLDQGGPRKFVQFLEAGLQSEAWETQLRESYSYKSLGEFQTLWNQWLADGSPADLSAYAPSQRLDGEPDAAALAAAPVVSAGQPDSMALVANGEQQPIALASAESAVEDMGTEGWYKRRLREISGSPATPVPPHNTMAKASLLAAPRVGQPTLQDSALRAQSQQASARPLPMQSPGIQVLDWGDRGPVQGIQQAGLPSATPLYR